MTVSVGVVDYGAGNIGSIVSMLARVGAEGRLLSDPGDLDTVDRVILPGVGHFDHGVRRLRSTGMYTALQELDTRSVPLLGICLGMQLLMEGSEEGNLDGLGLVPGRCERVQPGTAGLKVPHMGWNHVAAHGSSPFLASQPEGSRYYFVHSYHAVPRDPAHVAGTTTYGAELCAAVDRGDGVQGCQFHPEKSHRFGMSLLRTFVGEQS